MHCQLIILATRPLWLVTAAHLHVLQVYLSVGISSGSFLLQALAITNASCFKWSLSIESDGSEAPFTAQVFRLHPSSCDWLPEQYALLLQGMTACLLTGA